MAMMSQQLSKFSTRRWILILLLILIGFWGVLQFLPIGTDYYYYYRPIADQWMQGDRTMYDGPNHRLFYPPWNLLIILPLGFFSIPVGSALLNYTSLLLLFISISIIQRIKPVALLVIVLSILNLHMINLL